jgi:poly(ADP-ribose) glycohydrolase ARH3
MSLDVAACIITNAPLDQALLANTLAKSYRWSRGYGPGAAKTLRLIRRGVPCHLANRAQYRDGSLGNGAAIRVLPIAIARLDPSLIRMEVLRASEITHAHEEAKECAWVFAHVIAGLLSARSIEASLISVQCDNKTISDRIHRCLEILQDQKVSAGQIAAQLGSGMPARESVFCAIALAGKALEQPYKTLLGQARRCGGDVDSICAMAGALWGAVNGAAKLPTPLLRQLEGLEDLTRTAKRLFDLRAAGR